MKILLLISLIATTPAHAVVVSFAGGRHPGAFGQLDRLTVTFEEPFIVRNVQILGGTSYGLLIRNAIPGNNYVDGSSHTGDSIIAGATGNDIGRSIIGVPLAGRLSLFDLIVFFSGPDVPQTSGEMTFFAGSRTTIHPLPFSPVSGDYSIFLFNSQNGIISDAAVVIPEPSSALLMALAAFLLVRRVR